MELERQVEYLGIAYNAVERALNALYDAREVVAQDATLGVEAYEDRARHNVDLAYGYLTAYRAATDKARR